MLTIDKLNDFGADTADGLRRCMNMENFYIDLVMSVLDDSQLKELERAILAGELDHAFECAHALKGVYANLSLTPLLTPVSAITELLRAKASADYSELLHESKEAFVKLKSLAELFFPRIINHNYYHKYKSIPLHHRVRGCLLLL